MPLSRSQFNQIIDLLMEFVTSEDDRTALMQRAFYGEYVVNAVDYSGRPVGFLSNCIAKLEAYNGDSALIQLLETVRDHYLGDTRRAEVQTLIDDLQESVVIVEPMTSTLTHNDDTYIFISYSRKDAGFVNRLQADLDKNGIQYWID